MRFVALARRSTMSMPLRRLEVPALLLAIASLVPAGAPAAEKRADPSREAEKELQKATALLRAGRQDKGIEALEALLRKYPDEAAAEGAKELLRENGVGDEVRVTLLDRKFFLDGMKTKEGDVLDLAEKSLADLRKRYKAVKPYFTRIAIQLHFYDSQARYRKATGIITAPGDFTWTSLSDEDRSLAGKIEWHFPQTGLNPKDRMLQIRSVIFHEGAHYLTAVHFGDIVPRTVNEGISTYLESRLLTESFVGFRATLRQHYESDARNALATITKFPDFLALLEAERGFGKGDAMIRRWYGLCYAVFDLLAEGEIGGRRGTFEKVFAELDALCRSRTDGIEKGRPRPVLGNREVLEHLVKKVYGVPLEKFHAALVERVMKTYKRL